MNDINRLESIIRDYINNPRKQNKLLSQPAAWNQLCSCLDVLGDTELAIEAFINQKKVNDDGFTYLLVYGILQVLFVQQDAVENLAEALDIPYSKDPLLDQIRAIRNDSVGHPTKRGRKNNMEFNFIVRMSLSLRGFTILKTYPDSRPLSTTDVDIFDLISKQRLSVSNILLQFVDKLKEEAMKHREEFKNEKLYDIFPQTLSYYFEKMGQAIEGYESKDFGAMHIRLVADTIINFKQALEKRDILTVYESLNYHLELIEYPINMLTEFFCNNTTTKLNKDDAYIFMFFVKKQIDNIIKIAQEIDEDYSAEL